MTAHVVAAVAAVPPSRARQRRAAHSDDKQRSTASRVVDHDRERARRHDGVHAAADLSSMCSLFCHASRAKRREASHLGAVAQKDGARRAAGAAGRARRRQTADEIRRRRRTLLRRAFLGRSTIALSQRRRCKSKQPTADTNSDVGLDAEPKANTARLDYGAADNTLAGGLTLQRKLLCRAVAVHVERHFGLAGQRNACAETNTVSERIAHNENASQRRPTVAVETRHVRARRRAGILARQHLARAVSDQYNARRRRQRTSFDSSVKLNAKGVRQNTPERNEKRCGAHTQ